MASRNRCSGATEASRRLQERSEGLQDGPNGAPGGFKTASRALWEAPRRLQERSGRLRDGLTSVPGGLKTPQERSGRLQDGAKSVPGGSRRPQERSRRLQEVFKSTAEGSRRLKSALGVTQPLRSLIKSTWALLAVFKSAQRHPKWAFRNAFEETVRFRSAQMCKLLVS